MYVNANTGVEVNLYVLAQEINCSIPADPDDKCLEELGLSRLIPVEKPTPYHTRGSNQLVSGKWLMTWESPGLEEIKRAKISEINSLCETLLRSVRSSYPSSEVLSWDKQEAEARNGGGGFTQALAAARGLDHEELLKRIIAKADAFAAFSANLIGVRQRLADEISAASTAEEILAIEWPEDA